MYKMFKIKINKIVKTLAHNQDAFPEVELLRTTAYNKIRLTLAYVFHLKNLEVYGETNY